MGVSSLNGVQLIERLEILFQPSKWQPDLDYLRHVPLRRVHLFSVIQTVTLASMWLFKHTKYVSLSFPVCVLALCFIRKAMDFFFTQYELSWIDDLLPEMHNGTFDNDLQLVSSNPSNILSGKGEESTGCGGQMMQRLTSCHSSESGSLFLESGFGRATPFRHQPGIQDTDDIYSLSMSERVTKTSIWKRLLLANRQDQTRSCANRESPAPYVIFSYSLRMRAKLGGKWDTLSWLLHFR